MEKTFDNANVFSPIFYGLVVNRVGAFLLYEFGDGSDDFGLAFATIWLAPLLHIHLRVNNRQLSQNDSLKNFTAEFHRLASGYTDVIPQHTQ